MKSRMLIGLVVGSCLSTPARPVLWSAPELVVIPEVTGDVDDPALSDDQLIMVFNRDNDVEITTRASATAQWNPSQKITTISSSLVETAPNLGRDGLTIYFTRADAGTGSNVWLSARNDREQSWGAPKLMNELNSANSESDVTVTADGLVLVMLSDRVPPTTRLFQSVRASTDKPWPSPTQRDLQNIANPFLTADGLTLYYSTASPRDLYVTSRAEVSAQFPPGQPIAELNSDFVDEDPWVSPDGRTIYFHTNRDGKSQIYMAHR